MHSELRANNNIPSPFSLLIAQKTKRRLPDAHSGRNVHTFPITDRSMVNYDISKRSLAAKRNYHHRHSLFESPLSRSLD